MEPRNLEHYNRVCIEFCIGEALQSSCIHVCNGNTTALASLLARPSPSTRSLSLAHTPRWGLLLPANAHSTTTDQAEPIRNRRAAQARPLQQLFLLVRLALSPARASDDTPQCMACGIPRSALRLPSSLSRRLGGNNPFFVTGPLGLLGGDQGAVDGHASTWRDTHFRQAYDRGVHSRRTVAS